MNSRVLQCAWLLLAIAALSWPVAVSPLHLASGDAVQAVWVLAFWGLSAVVGARRWLRSDHRVLRLVAVCVASVVYLGLAPMLGLRATLSFLVPLVAAALLCLPRATAPLVVGAAVSAGVVLSIATVLDAQFLWTARAANVARDVADAVPGIAGARPQRLGFTHLGGWALVLVAPVLIWFIVHVRGALRVLAVSLSATTLVAAVLVWNALQPSLLRTGALLAAGAVVMSLASAPVVTTASRTRVGGVSMAALLVAFAIAFAPVPWSRGRGDVLLLRGDYLKDLPTPERPSRPKGAALGYFVEYLRQSVPLREADDVPAAIDDRVSLVIVSNRTKHFTQPEIEALQSFVRQGGGMLVFGDHTNIKGVMEATNPLTQPFGMRLAFDSAMPDPSGGLDGWQGALKLRRHPATAAVGAPDDCRISVGATLELAGEAIPLIVASAGYSDAGDPKAPHRAYLGNWRLDRATEAQGDLVLAATCASGKGRVACFGDTAILQEGSFARSWPLVGATVEWLRRSDKRECLVAPWLVLLALLASGAAVLVAIRHGGLPTPSAPVVALAAALALIVFAEEEWSRQSARANLPLPARAGWVDVSSGTDLQLHGKTGRPVDGLLSIIAATGRVPLLRLGGFESLPLRPGDLVAVLPGGQDLDSSRRDALLRHCEAGGTVLVSGGSADAWRLRSLLDAARVELIDLPLGRCPGATSSEGETAPRFAQAFGLRPLDGSAEVLVRCWDFPVVVRKRLGLGTLVYVSDADALADKCTKDGDDPSPSAVRFYCQALDGARR